MGRGRAVVTSTAPNVLAEPVAICMLGSFRVFSNGVPLALRPGGKVEQLLASLALGRRAGVPRDELLGLLWPDSDASLASQSLNSLLYSLRKTLRPALGGRPAVAEHDGRFVLNIDHGIGIDVVAFDAAVDEGDRSAREGQTVRAIDSYQGAIGLYAGDLVVGPAVEHLLERERLRARFLAVCARLADHHFDRGEYSEALDQALQLLARDPCREDAHRMAMRCYVRLGIRAQAIRQYRLCRQILADEFDAPPEEATERLCDLVRLHPELV